MTDEAKAPSGPDLERGIRIEDLAEGRPLLGHAGGEPAIVVRRGQEVFAIGSSFTHYGGPLGEGLVVGETVRCPWHHACFSLRTGEALAAPALNPVSCWGVEQQDGKIYVREKLEPAEGRARMAAGAGPESIVIIGGGAAGEARRPLLARGGG